MGSHSFVTNDPALDVVTSVEFVTEKILLGR